MLGELYALCEKHKGKYPIIFHMMTSQSRMKKIISNKILVNNHSDFLKELRSLLGSANVWIS